MAKVKDPTAPNTYDDYAKEVSNKFVEMLESGTAPWQKEWKGAELSSIFPRNASTGKNYNGINVLNLMAEAQIKNYDDPRWVTYNQAKAMGGSVKAGEKSSKIEFWQFGKEIDKLDDNGKPILGEDGKPEKVFMRYQTPTHTFHSVFNVTQCDGIPPLTKEELTPQREFIPIEMAEKILHNSGAIINFDKSGRSAYYQPHSDQITLPSKELFSSEMGFYSTALHELGHWTGHDSRLNRDMSHPFGSDGYAKEELRAEIASFMLCSELGVDFDPTNHGAYVKSWCKNLEEEPKEIFRASSDALKITNYVMALSLEKEKEVEKAIGKDAVIGDFQALKDYTKQLGEEFPKFVTLDGAFFNHGLYSNYIMANQDNSVIKDLHITIDGKQEWKDIDIDTAKTRFENAYKAYMIKEWGLDQQNEQTKDEISLEQKAIETSMENHYVFPSNPINTLPTADNTRFDVKAFHNHYNEDRDTVSDLTIPKEAVEDAIKRYGTADITGDWSKGDYSRLVEMKIGQRTYHLSVDEKSENGTFTIKDTLDNTPFETNAWTGSTITTLTPFNDPELLAGEENHRVVEEEIKPLLDKLEKGEEININDIKDVRYSYEKEMERKGIADYPFSKKDENALYNNQKEVLTHYLNALSPQKDYHSDPLVLETKRLTDITRFNETDLTNRINATPHQNLSIPKEAVEDAIKRYGILEHKDDTIRYVELKINDELFILNETPTHGILTPRDSYNDTMFKDMAWSGSTTTTLTPQSEQTMNIEPPKKSYPTIQNPNAKYPNATVLNVDYHSKDKASLLGARWEQSEKTWVAPVGTDLSKLEQWLVAPQKEIREYKDPYVEFGEALKEKGLILDGDPIMDGKIHRVQVEGDKLNQKSGAYSGHLDGRPAGYIQNYKTDERVNWKAQSFNQDNVVSLNPTPEQQEAKKLANEQKAIERQKEIEAKHNEVSVNVRTKFNEAREVGLTHPYLDAKGVQNYGLKLDERNNLLMPLRDIDDKIWTAQAINTNFKGFEKDGKKEGNFFTIGEHHSTSKELLICEGYATGASIHEATGKGVIVAVDAGNLEAVGVALRERYPDKVIAFMADDDISKATDGKKNVGRLSAEEASEVVKGVVVYPQLTASEIKDGKSDFNDIHKSRGLAELKSQLTLKMDKFLVKEDRALTPQRDKAVEPAKGLER